MARGRGVRRAAGAAARSSSCSSSAGSSEPWADGRLAVARVAAVTGTIALVLAALVGAFALGARRAGVDAPFAAVGRVVVPVVSSWPAVSALGARDRRRTASSAERREPRGAREIPSVRQRSRSDCNGGSRS